MDSLTVNVDEYGRTSVSDSWIERVDKRFWAQTGVTISKVPSDEAWTLKADKFVGIARTKTEDGWLTLQVRPKLENCDTYFLANYAYGQRSEPLRLIDADDALLESLRSDPVACLLLWHVRAIDKFAARWLRRGYQAGEVVLNGTVRGKLMLSQYVKRYVSTGQNHNVPCRVTMRTHDTPNNRILKAGLREVAVLAQTLPVPSARSAIVRSVNAALPRFSQVSDVKVTPADLRQATAKGPFRHYESILHTTKELLAGNLFGSAIGVHSTDAFMWEMPTLFQEAVRGILDASDAFNLDNRRAPVAKIVDALGQKKTTSKVDPDFVLNTDAGVLLLDTKYKKALATAAQKGATDGTGDDEALELVPGRKIKVTRSDVYQMAAYRQHERWPEATVALLYPVALSPDEPLPSPYRVENFGDPIHITFIDVGPNAQTNLPQFEARLQSLLSDPTYQTHS